MTYPGSRIDREPTRAQLDEREDECAQERAAMWGARCLDLAQELVEETDRYPSQWRWDDMGKLRALHEALTAALTMAKEIKP